MTSSDDSHLTIIPPSDADLTSPEYPPNAPTENDLVG